jgi:hypothetical protein
LTTSAMHLAHTSASNTRLTLTWMASRAPCTRHARPNMHYTCLACHRSLTHTQQAHMTHDPCMCADTCLARVTRALREHTRANTRLTCASTALHVTCTANMRLQATQSCVLPGLTHALCTLTRILHAFTRAVHAHARLQCRNFTCLHAPCTRRSAPYTHQHTFHTRSHALTSAFHKLTCVWQRALHAPLHAPLHGACMPDVS